MTDVTGEMQSSLRARRQAPEGRVYSGAVTSVTAVPGDRYLSPTDRRAETEPAEERIIGFEWPDLSSEGIDREFGRCRVCGANPSRHTPEGWELHQEEVRRRVRHMGPPRIGDVAGRRS